MNTSSQLDHSNVDLSLRVSIIGPAIKELVHSMSQKSDRNNHAWHMLHAIFPW